jgi:hypothetical protein
MAEGKSERRPGRPRRYESGRINATVRFTPERYADLKTSALQSGRSISEEVEVRVERALQYDRTVAAMGTTLAGMEQGSIDAVLIRKGYTIVDRDPDTLKKLWAEPGFPNIEHLRGRFIPLEENQ